MPKCGADDGDWEKHKDSIIRLYKHENEPLSKVMALMSDRNGFKRTKAQYERKLRAWGLKKYSKAQEWKFIARRLHEREAQHLQTSVELRGLPIPDAKVRKEVARYAYQTTVERFTSVVPYRPRSETPPGIRVRTPPPRNPLPPAPLDSMQHIWESGLDSSDLAIYWSDEVIYCLSKCTPWYPFMRFIHSLDTGGPSQLLLLPSNTDRSNPSENSHPIPTLSVIEDNTEIVQGLGNSLFLGWLDDLLCATFMQDLSQLSIALPISCHHPGPYLPPMEGPSDINLENIMDLSQRSSQLEFLKHAVHLVANNIDTRHITSVVVELAQDKHNRALLQTLVDQKLLIAEALVEKLLFPAVRGRNIPLLEIILRAGCDVNLTSFEHCDFYPNERGQTALQCAIELRDHKLVSFLLTHGADGSMQGLRVKPDGIISSYRTGSLLDFAVELGEFAIAEDLLTARPQFAYDCPRITVYTLRFAILRGDIDTFHYLMERAVHEHDRLRQEPWTLLEAAAFHKDPSTFSAVVKYGLDVTQINESGSGSALAAASASNQLELVRRLYHLGVDISTIAVGFDNDDLVFKNSPNLESLLVDSNPDWFGSERRCRLDLSLASINGMAALHAAVKNQNREIVEFLISNGANVNQCYYPPGYQYSCSPVFPLQVATYYGNETLVSMLLDAGADPNSVAGDVMKELFNFSSFRSVVGRPSLRIALELGSKNIFELLLRRGAYMPTLSIGSEEWDPLLSAAQGRNHQLVRTVFHQYRTANVAIHKALAECIRHCGELWAELIECGSIPPKDVYCEEVLCAAVERGDAELVQKLLKDARINLEEFPPGYAAAGFALAARLRKYDMFPSFVNAGAKPYERLVSTGESPIAIAILCASTGLLAKKHLELLIDECEPPGIGSYEHEMWRDSMYSACRHAIHQRQLDLVTLMVSKGVDAKWVPAGETTHLQLSLNWGSFDIAEYLLDLGADPNTPATPRYGGLATHTPLQSAAQYSSKIFERLLKIGADIHAKPAITHGATALQLAAMSGHFQNLNILLKAGARINEPAGQYEGRTAIEGAAEHGRLNMVRYLLEAGADIRGRRNKNYRRTVWRAWESGHRTVVCMIQEWKGEKYGQKDCEDIESILESMTFDELAFESVAAKADFENWFNQDETVSTMHPEGAVYYLDGKRIGWERERALRRAQ